MKFTLSWLKEHLKTKATVEEIATKLSAIGLEVESVDDPATRLGAFTIARVIDAKQHPNADRLRVAQVEIAKDKPPVEVVCGAPNCRAGMLTVYAPVGTFIPGSGITLEKKPVRGVASNGMLCSEAELELSDESAGIIDIAQEHADAVGSRYIDALGLADPVFEVKLTPNRPDCTGVRGIARDLAAAGLGTLKHEPRITGVEGATACPIDIKLEFAAGAPPACPIFAGRCVTGVQNGPSPEWLQNRLKAIGLRPINALVDVTNYISFDLGRPLHVYDADKLKGAIRARLGKAGETFLGLDGKEHAVDETMCVIADDSGPLGLGGILGGEASGCTDATRSVFIESAWFDPIRIATTGRKTGVVSDARYRFERGVDPQSVVPGLDLATQMILKHCGGHPTHAKIAGEAPAARESIAFDLGRVEKLTGVALPEAEIRTILETLGFTLSGKGPTLAVMAPSWRPDIHGPADLIEEVIRIAGLDRVTATPLPKLHGVAQPVLTDRQKRQRRARRALAARGMVEAVTWSFLPRKEAQAFGGGADVLELQNPISADLSSMRPSLLPGLLAAVERNRNRGMADVALFELGQAYRGDGETDQFVAISGVRAGTARVAGMGRYWDGKAEAINEFDAKADVVAVLTALGLDAAKVQLTRDAPAWFHPGRSATFRLGPKVVLAHFGEVHPDTLRTLDVTGPVVAFELFLDAMPPEKRKSRTRAPLAAADLLPVRRDFAFVLDQGVAAGDVLRAAAAADKTLIQSVTVFDVFEGGQLAAEGKKSMAIEVTIQPTAATLTDKEIEALSQKIVADVKKATGGEIRS